MSELSVEIIRYFDDAQPGWVECRLKDAWGKEHTFIDKAPIFTSSELNKDSNYPQYGVIACQVVRRWRDPHGREIVTIDMEHPWHVESSSGDTRFDVLATQLNESSPE